MRILAIEPRPFHETMYLNAAPGGGTTSSRLPWLRGRVAELPRGLDALLVASDLQGMAPSSTDGVAVLLGVALADELFELDAAGAVPPLARVGIVLAGDLYSAPSADARGATGDVRDVWLALAACSRWVVGVAGNHDVFGASPREAERFHATEGVHLLDGDAIELDGVRFAGVGGIIGAKVKPGRRSPGDYGATLDAALAGSPDVLVLHEGPDVPDARLDGSPAIREVLDARDGPSPLVVCGHTHWREPLASLPRGAQVMNVDARVVLLERG